MSKGMTRSLLCKLLQRQTYDILSHRYYLALFFLAFLLLLVSLLRFGEVFLIWSTEKYGSVFNFYSNNIMGRSYEEKLCQHLPIDVVYTWVNGSDPELLEDLSQLKKEIETKLNISKDFKCPFAHCIESHMVILHPRLPPTVGLHDLMEADYIFTDARKIFAGNNPSAKTNQLSGSIIVFDSREAAIVCTKKKTIAIREKNYSVQPAYLTTEWTAPNSMMLADTAIVTLVSSQLTEDEFLQKLPANMRQHVLRVFLYHEKGMAVLTVPDKSALESVLQWEGNFTIDHKEPGLNAANLVLYFTEESLNDDISASRFQDNEELRYSLRSIEKFAPWVQHIYIVTNGQIPYWLNLENPRVSIVTHEELYPNKSHLPTFSSPSIETHLHRIPGLSKKFLYMNDDVIFGKDIWPEDFYTRAKGHKVYLSWSVPECHEGCPASWISDGYCDKPCNNSDCQWDGGDCKDGNTGMIFGNNLNQNFQIWKDETEKMYCMPNCANTWIADRYCDQACNSYACGFDAGDCGTENYDKLYAIHLEEEKHQYVLPIGINVAYFNLTRFLSVNKTLLDGSYEDSAAIRAIAINQKFKTLTILVHNNQSMTPLVFLLKGIRNGFDFQFQFNVTIDTSVVLESIINNTEIPKRNTTVVLQSSLPVQSTTTAVLKFEEFPENMKFPRIKNDTDKRFEASIYGLVNTSAVDFPLNVSMALKTLDDLYSNDELTMKGFKKKKAKIINNYLHYLEKQNITRPNFVYEVDVGEKNITNSSLVISESSKLADIVPQTDNANDGLTSKTLRKILGFNIAENTQLTSWTLENGHFPWEQKDTFSNIQKAEEAEINYASNKRNGRRLLDTFGDSLRHVNRLFNKAFGYEPRKVPAHMPHLVDVEVIRLLQLKFAEEFDITSSHKIRNTTDMQFAFSFFYFLMNEKKHFDIETVFDEFDTDSSGTWSDREIRTILARVHELPITYNAVLQFENEIINCSKHLPSDYSEGISIPPFERYLNSKLLVVSRNLVRNCTPIANLLHSKFKLENKYRYEIVGEEEVAFKMIHTNISQVIAQLDDIRKNPRKFICLNDNIEHDKEESVEVKAVLIDFYESFFPIPSQFELPKEYRNRFLHMRDLREWQCYRSFVQALTYVGLIMLVLICLASLFRNQMFAIWRKLCQRRTFLKISRSRKRLENV